MVVGDQSSGKSSLLEGITELSFPTDSDICTRYATQIILRRSDESKAVISIIPGANSLNDETTVRHLEAFKRNMPAGDFDGKKVKKVLNDASVHMGLPAIGAKLDSTEAPAKRFSDDIVQIELSGPSRNHLSVVDVPGLFHNPTKFQTAEDKEIIRRIVKVCVCL